jgi:hypothetical protein
MAPVGQANPDARVEIFDHRVAAQCAVQRVGHGGIRGVEWASDAGPQPVPVRSEGIRCPGLAPQHTDLAHEIARHVVSPGDRLKSVAQHGDEREQIVALVLQGAAVWRDAHGVQDFTLMQFGHGEIE